MLDQQQTCFHDGVRKILVVDWTASLKHTHPLSLLVRHPGGHLSPSPPSSLPHRVVSRGVGSAA